MGIWGVGATIAAAWFAASIVVGIAWVMGRRIFRKTPDQQHAEDAAQVEYLTEYRNRKAGV